MYIIPLFIMYDNYVGPNKDKHLLKLRNKNHYGQVKDDGTEIVIVNEKRKDKGIKLQGNCISFLWLM